MSLAHALGVSLRQRSSCCCSSAAGLALRRAAGGSGGGVAPARQFATKQQQPASGSAAQFYKTFTRPIGKVLVLAIFTYQVAYWTWLKLEADEHRAETDGESTASSRMRTSWIDGGWGFLLEGISGSGT
ncbi:hypothetical protein A9Z42_0046670 [Trichoderma parareesei]|uniref:Uncharacterized protein n=1 Tax=Trichoderma parareesei TaxID=858221 RepID=A0A2H2ZDY4_TRIPA|nr:hypothetical protein A9Z42_0046670 [Trichoderma parareesei]